MHGVRASSCMHRRACLCVCIRVCVRPFVFVHACVRAFLRVHLRAPSACLCRCTYAAWCVRVRTYAYAYAHVYVHAHAHTHAYVCASSLVCACGRVLAWMSKNVFLCARPNEQKGSMCHKPLPWVPCHCRGCHAIATKSCTVRVLEHECSCACVHVYMPRWRMVCSATFHIHAHLCV